MSGPQRKRRRGPSIPYSQRVSVVTGAGSGIGRALAVDLLARGTKVALVDIDLAGLAETVRISQAPGHQILSQRLDVTDDKAVNDYASSVIDHYGRVDQVLNVAGVIHTGDLLATTPEQFRHVIDVDFWGVVNSTTAFLPHLIRDGGGQLVNVSSAFGLITAPGYTAYNSAKFAVRGFTDALRQEMTRAQNPITVSCAYPGGVKTPIMRHGTYGTDSEAEVATAQFDRYVARTSPEDAARHILRGSDAGKPSIFIGADARVADVLARVSGTGYHHLLQMVLKYQRGR